MFSIYGITSQVFQGTLELTVLNVEQDQLRDVLRTPDLQRYFDPLR